jgi:hypothetical protein
MDSTQFLEEINDYLGEDSKITQWNHSGISNRYITALFSGEAISYWVDRKEWIVSGAGRTFTGSTFKDAMDACDQYFSEECKKSLNSESTKKHRYLVALPNLPGERGFCHPTILVSATDENEAIQIVKHLKGDQVNIGDIKKEYQP